MIISKLSHLQGELFDLVVATVNYLESYDISTVELVYKINNNNLEAQEILDILISELEELSSKKIVNTRFEHQSWENPHFITKIPIIEGDDKWKH